LNILGTAQPDWNEDVKKGSRVSIVEALTKFVFMSAWIVTVFLLYVFLGDKPFGIQIATIIAYSGSVFCLVFFRWRFLDEAYNLRIEAVQEQIPRLLAIHLAFLGFIVAVLTLALFLRSQLPSFWFTERFGKHGSLFSHGLLLICTLAAVTQVFICRTILSRSIGKKKSRGD
jgi:hypothetical protein